MSSHLTGLSDFPLSQPYFIAPWEYPGTESVACIPADIVDWILVELRDALDATSATSATSVSRQAAFLKNDGSIVGIDGSSILFVPYTPVSQLFAVIWQRNHLGIMSSAPLVLGGGIYSYDFTTSASQSYLNGQKSLGGGKYGMFAGDADGNGNINTNDLNIWSSDAGKSGYYRGDMDMNSEVNSQDKNDVWFENNGQNSQVPE